MPEVLRPARLILDPAGIPCAPDYGDIYHSRAGSYAQAREVFLAGNNLPAAWAGRRSFTIVETGFGLGTNFLATWAAWRGDARRPARLHYVSVERHPFSAADLRAWHARDAEMAPLGEALAAAWPVLTPGMHRIELDQGKVILTLVFGSAEAALPSLRLRADAFYPDGFGPRRNPDMWSAAVFSAMARLAAPDATLATYTVAHGVVRRLTEAGFAVSKAPGFGGKNDMLVGRIEAPAGGVLAAGRLAGMPVGSPTGNPAGKPAAFSAASADDRHALVIGAGIAGVSAASSLAARGWRVTLLDSAAGVARGASSTPAGALHAVLARDDSRLARFTRAAYLYMERRLAALTGGVACDWAAHSGRVHCIGEGEAFESAEQLVASLGFPPTFVSAVDAAAASDLAGTRMARGGYWFPRTAWLQAGTYCAALMRGCEGIHLHAGAAVHALRRMDSSWEAIDAAGVALARAPVVVLAAGVDLPRLAPGTTPLPLQSVRGQLSGVPASQAHAPRIIVSGEGYCLPAVQGTMWVGASYGPNDAGAEARTADHAGNLERLARLLPENDFRVVPTPLAAHVGFRAVAPDRLPLVGALPQWDAAASVPAGSRNAALDQLAREPGLYAIGGLGSRGLSWAALAGETVACMIEGEPLPLEAELLDAVDPARFLARRLRRGQPV